MDIADSDGRLVDVIDPTCLYRGCYGLGVDKGVFRQGRGYTAYHADERMSQSVYEHFHRS